MKKQLLYLFDEQCSLLYPHFPQLYTVTEGVEFLHSGPLVRWSCGAFVLSSLRLLSLHHLFLSHMVLHLLSRSGDSKIQEHFEYIELISESSFRCMWSIYTKKVRDKCLL